MPAISPDGRSLTWSATGPDGKRMAPQALTTRNAVRNEHAHLWSQFLQDGHHFIFFVASDSGASTGIYAGSLDSPNYSLIFASKTNAGDTSGRSARGYLLFIRESSLVGQPFNAARLQAPARR